MLTKTTRIATPAQIEKKWYVIDAANQTLGRLATEAAVLLRGKHKPYYTPHIDTGDYVIIINAEKIKLTGNKLDKKMYYRHTGYPGHLKATKYRDLINDKPAFVLEKAIKGMLPHNKLGRFQFGKLKVYAGSDHKHAAQTPETYTLKG